MWLKNIMYPSSRIYTPSEQITDDMFGIVHVFIPAHAFGDRDIIHVPFGHNWIAVPKNVPNGVCYGSSIGEIFRIARALYNKDDDNERIYTNIFGERTDRESKYKHVTVQVYMKNED